jgi:hypothetical protein
LNAILNKLAILSVYYFQILQTRYWRSNMRYKHRNDYFWNSFFIRPGTDVFEDYNEVWRRLSRMT